MTKETRIREIRTGQVLLHFIWHSFGICYSGFVIIQSLTFAPGAEGAEPKTGN